MRLLGKWEGMCVLLLRAVELGSCCGLLFTSGRETELVEFAGGVVFVVVRFERLDLFRHEVFIFERRCHA